MKYIVWSFSQTISWQKFAKTAQDFHHAVSKVFDRVKSVALWLWSANIRKLAKDHKGYGSAARSGCDCMVVGFPTGFPTTCAISAYHH
jgi:hypothetical protein